MTDNSQLQPRILEMKYCHGCGQQIHKSAKSCPTCGAQQLPFGNFATVNNPENWKQIYFSFNGRIGRQTWWLSHLALLIPLCGIGIFAAVVAPKDAAPSGAIAFLGLATLVWFATYLWAGFCLNAKRWHDTDKSGWWQLIGAIPLIGIWALIENGFLRGTEGPNRFGPDPLA